VEHIAAADLAIHAGDFVELSTLRELEGIGPPVVAVHGNVDSEEVRSRLPETQVVEAAGARIGLIHDAGPARGRFARMRRRFPDADAVVFGHSHIPLHDQDESFQIFNPGSPTDRRRQPVHTMGLAHVEDGRITLTHVALD
jgi:putative phosphoesterase